MDYRERTRVRHFETLGDGDVGRRGGDGVARAGCARARARHAPRGVLEALAKRALDGRGVWSETSFGYRC